MISGLGKSLLDNAIDLYAKQMAHGGIHVNDVAAKISHFKALSRSVGELTENNAFLVSLGKLGSPFFDSAHLSSYLPITPGTMHSA
jgi:hypothetical protein